MAVAQELKGEMEEQQITSGRFAGMGMFTAMEKSAIGDVQAFLDFMLSYPANYLGKDWRVADKYATWLINNCPEGNKNYIRQSDGKTTGIKLADNQDNGFPRIEELNTSIWGNRGYELDAGALALKLADKSLYGENASTIQKKFNNGSSTVNELTVYNHGVIKTIYIKLHNNPVYSGKKIFEEKSGDKFPRLLTAKKNGKTGFVDAAGNLVIPIKYDEVKDESEGIFKEGLMGVKIGKKWGFINLLGDMVIQPKWEKIYNFSEKLCGFSPPGSDIFDAKKGYIDKKGIEVIPAKYYSPLFGSDFHDGLAGIRVNEKTGFINREGKIIIPPDYYLVKRFSDGLAAAVKVEDGKYGYLDKKGNWAITPQYDQAYDFIDGRAMVEKDGKHQMIDKNGNVKIRFEEKLQVGFTRAKFYDNRIIYSKNEMFGILNEKGKRVTPPKFKGCGFLYSEGLIGVSETCEGSALSCEGGYYFIDVNGEKVINGPFEDVSTFSEGVCWVKKGGVWGLIDKSGNWLIEPMLDNMPSLFTDGISQGYYEVQGSGFLPDKIYFYFTKRGEIIWEPK